MNKQYIYSFNSSQADLGTVGGKGASLSKLAIEGLPVPGGFHVITEAYRRFVTNNRLQDDIMSAISSVDISKPDTLEAASKVINELFVSAPIPGDIVSEIISAYESLPGSNPAVAVRSSATAEDLPEASFAGQQESYLNVSGVDSVLEATRKCWASLWTARAIGYRARKKIGIEGLALAVVVQILVPAEAAGIMFTANPLNGKRDGVVINGSWGLGEAIVGGAVTPDTLTVEKSTGEMIHREIAQKLVQTVMVDSGTKEKPVPRHLQNVPVLSDEQAYELAQIGIQIEEHYDMPMDIEWTLADGTFAIVQARPITALPAPPLEWFPPYPKGVYMRGSVVDLMPDPLSPLFVTLGIPTLKNQMQPLGKRVTRKEPILSDDYFTSINGYAYMNATMPPKAWSWILTGLIPSYPRIFKTIVALWRDEFHPEYKAYVNKLRDKKPEEMTPEELWKGAQETLDATMYYVCALMFATMGASAGSEMLLTKVYDKFARQEGDPPASTLLMGWDNIPVRSEKSLYDMATYCFEHEGILPYILETPAEEIADQLTSDVSPDSVGDNEWDAFQRKFQEHMKVFGHIIYQLDFAEDLPLDHPEPMLETIKMYLRGGGINPYERQRASEEKRIQTAEIMKDQLKGFKRWAFTKALNWGQSLAEVREDALADIGLGYPMMRKMLKTLGQHFVEADVIRQADDIFWLEKDEIGILVGNIESGADVKDYSSAVTDRKAFWEQAKKVTPPPMMPVKKRVMGVKADVFVPHSEGEQTEGILKGVPASAGVVTAPARVLHGPDDFNQMCPGDILVAGTTTPAWTPLFTMASAVVTDIGGPLSHGSIVAREYGIPAVMGTGIATRRIQNGQIITVDGEAGIVTLE